MSDKKFNVGDRVKYIGKDHREMPEFYPPVGTIGTVVKQLNEYDDVYVQWEKGSTSKEDCWYCDRHDVELVKNEDMTNEEIWEMLKPKMEKNGLNKKMGGLHIGKNLVDGFWVYSIDNVHNAIALAYKVGYLRSQKGRPFKFDEKKKKGGHWEPVDVKEIPKAGYKITNNGIDWGYEYIGTYKKGHDGRFYQWVEDDE